MTTTQFPVVRPSQRLRNLAQAMKLSGERGDFPTSADTLEEIACAVAENEERQAQTAELEAALEEIAEIANHADIATTDNKRILCIANGVLGGAK